MRPAHVMALGAAGLSGLASAVESVLFAEHGISNPTLYARDVRGSFNGQDVNSPGGFRTGVNFPLRSEGICKFAVDVMKDQRIFPMLGPAIICPAGGEPMLNNMRRHEVALLAARLAVEYDLNCKLTEDTSHYVAHDPSVNLKVFDRNHQPEVRHERIGNQTEIFYLDCGAVFLNRPFWGPSGSGQYPQVRMVRDSRGYMPLMAPYMPNHVFKNFPNAEYGADSQPPWLAEVIQEIDRDGY
ncbi:hypothetical protein V2A60_002636 [Cordyceps javanica]|uniref:Uncharacterized protein n=1 Tax=Cordyceps javanica TaxID=43265 RepID=A0A545UY07_9HYPO|nr:hypothetical protein IF1G_07207 [Cordyceps javanica]TQW06204.1 hypothetical protein IF2G_06487 [Cordyceps javanica]